MVAEFYVTAERISEGYITWDQLREMAAAGMGIGAHDLAHFQLAGFGPGRAAYPADVMWTQITGIRELIHANLGIWPDSMAYVGGSYDATLLGLVAKAGYPHRSNDSRGLRA
jgi:peptidoglycan/xylan/chitin deacetylase (PgdA/CDA1 family)